MHNTFDFETSKLQDWSGCFDFYSTINFVIWNDPPPNKSDTSNEPLNLFNTLFVF